MPKKALVLLLALSLLSLMAGCSTGSYVLDANTPESTIKGYYDTLLKADYTAAAQYISQKNLDFIGLTRDEYITGLQETASQNALKLNSYSIGEIRDIDDSHKIATVFYKSQANNQSLSGTDEFLIVSEDGKWKLDYAMALNINKLTENQTLTMHGGVLEISDIVLAERPDGIGIRLSITNKTKNSLKLGWSFLPQIKLETDKGTWLEKSPYIQIDIGTKQTISGVIKGARGNIKKISIDEAYFTTNDGEPLVTGGESIAFNL